MVFSSPAFMFFFLPLFFAVYFATPVQRRNLIILLLSLLFYFADAGELIAILGASILFNHFAAHWIERAIGVSRRVWLAVGVVANLAPLFWFKYWVFFGSVANNLADWLHLGLRLPLSAIALPAGISFFTFHAISYLADVYWRKVKPAHSLVDFGMYMANFPQLIAGPIVRYSEIVDVVERRPSIAAQVNLGLCTFAIGLGKKIILADNVASIADGIFALPPGELTFGLAWLGVLAYALQIYFDFSGYSDMAIGLGRMMGFEFPLNFDFPYQAKSVTEFWRRWHMTLSRWFRDYLYIPLGGNRCGPLRTYLNLFIVFFLCGLWHGGAWGFVVWGLWHGALLVVERVLLRHWGIAPRGWWGQGVTFVLVMVGWVFFRAENLSSALTYLTAMVGVSPTPTPVVATSFYLAADKLVYLLIASVLALVPLGAVQVFKDSFMLRQRFEQGRALFLLAFSCALIAANGFNPFIYFRF